MKNHSDLTPSEAAKHLGSISTPKKAAAAARNGAANQFKPQPLPACNCNRCPAVYALDAKAGDAKCPRAKIIRQRQWRARKPAAQP